MENKQKLIIAAVVIAVVLAIVAVIIMRDDESNDITDNENIPGEERIDPFKDAPAPWANEEELDQIRDLWPDAFDKSKVDREEVKKEWQEFASVYPENVYIPSRFLPEQSAEQKKEKRELLDKVTSISTKIANSRAKQRKASSGNRTPAIDPGTGDVTPEEQTLYFTEKLKELESRKQLIKYALDNKGLDPDQTGTAQADIAQIDKEIANIKQVMGQIPGS